jgi:integrase
MHNSEPARTPALTHEDLASIPYSAFREVLNLLPAAHPVRVGLLLLALTGCRVKELDAMSPQSISEGWIHWRLGKNQRGMRREPLPAWFLAELAEYRAVRRVPGARLLGFRASQLSTYFNKLVRPCLSAAWHDRHPLPYPGFAREQYRLQVKGLRKSFATTVFFREYERWQDAGVALEFASKRLKHRTTHMTAHHYLKEFDVTEPHLWEQFLEGERAPASQIILAEYLG